MEGILGIGIPEILLVFVLALVLLGPQDMVASARKLGLWINRLVRSPIWREVMNTSNELRNLPTKIVREAGLEDTIADLKKTQQEVTSEIKETTAEVSSELKQTRQEMTAETLAAVNQVKSEARASLEDSPTPTEPAVEVEGETPVEEAQPGAEIETGAGAAEVDPEPAADAVEAQIAAPETPAEASGSEAAPAPPWSADEYDI